MKLSERLEEAWRKLYGDGDEHAVCDTIAEAAELARRVEDAEVGRRYAHADDDWIVTPDEDGGVDHPYVRVRIVPEAGHGGG